MKSKKYLVVLSLALLVLPAAALAQAYVPLVGIPGIDPDNLNFNDYINALYALSISVGALIAVIKIIIAGMKYMLSDIVTNKQEAIGDIQGAIFGLIIVISAVLILNVINPNLTEFNTQIITATSTPKAAPIVAPPGSGGGLSQAKDLPCEAKTASADSPGSSFDCSSARTLCATQNGRPNESATTAASGQLRCEYGVSNPIPCTHKEADCTAARNKCLAMKGGSPYVVLGSRTIIECITPF